MSIALIKKYNEFIAGALVSSVATVVFNILSTIAEFYKKPDLKMPSSTWDIAPGCAIAIIGIAMTEKNKDKLISMFLSGFMSIFVLIIIDFIIPVTLDWSRGFCIVAADIIQFLILTIVIIKAG